MIYNVPPICRKMVQFFDGKDVFVDGYSTVFRAQHGTDNRPFIYQAGSGSNMEGVRNYGDHIGVSTGSCLCYEYSYLGHEACLYMVKGFDASKHSKIEFNVVSTTAFSDMSSVTENDGIYVALFKNPQKWIFSEGNAVAVAHVPLYKTTSGLYNDTPFALEKVSLDIKGVNEPVYIGFFDRNDYGLSDLSFSVYLGDINLF